MAKSAEDRILDFLRARGDAGADADEIAREFLQAKATGRVADAIVTAMLGKDARFVHGDGGRWRGPPEPAATAGTTAGKVTDKRYTVVEFLMLPLGGGETPIEAAALREPRGAGRNEAQTLVQFPGALPSGARLPDGIDAAALQKALPLTTVLDGMAKFSRGTTVLSFEKTPFHARVCAGASLDKELDHLSLKALARRLRLVAPGATLRQTAEALGVFCPESPRAAERAEVCVELLHALRQRYAERRAKETHESPDAVAPQPDELVELQKPAFQEVDFSHYGFDGGFLQTLPETPGVYIMVDASGNAVYVGKAKDLRRRVGSYFRRRVQRDEKTEQILESVYDIVVEPVGSELEALLAEHRAIARLAPPINRQQGVHERHPSRERPANVILVLPSTAAGQAELFMVCGGAFLTQVQVPCDDVEAARDAVSEVYFSDGAGDETDRNPEELEILWSWLEQNKDAVNRIDVDAVGDADEILRLLRAYVAEDQHGGRTYHR